MAKLTLDSRLFSLLIIGGQLGVSIPNCLVYEAGAKALPFMGGDMTGTCDEASRLACRSLAGASACSCP